MTTSSPRPEEEYIKRRYERWRDMAVPFAYKERKSVRIAQILLGSGGLPRVALELGVGPGGIAGPISQRGMRVVGIDLSAEALERARAHCRGNDVILLRCSGFSLPFRDESFPLVYASQVLHLFDTDGRLRLIHEVSRVLCPGGRFVFDLKNAVSHVLRYWRYSAGRRQRSFPTTKEIEELLTRAGFASVEVHPGVMPGLGALQVPNLAIFRAIAHTRFFVARKS